MTTQQPEYITPSQFQTKLPTVARGCTDHGWRVPIHRERIRDWEVQHPWPGYLIARWDYEELAEHATLPEPATVLPRVARAYASTRVLPRVEAGEAIEIVTRNWRVVCVPRDALDAAAP